MIEKEILIAAFQKEPYTTIAKNSHLSIGHIKDVAYKFARATAFDNYRRESHQNRFTISGGKVYCVASNKTPQSSDYLTLSIGIANMIPPNDGEVEELIIAAKTMLSGLWIAE